MIGLTLALAAVVTNLDPGVARAGSGWVTEAGTDHCAMMQKYEGEGSPFVAFATSFDVPDKVSVLMAIHNDNWSLKADRTLKDISIEIDGHGGAGAIKTGNGALAVIFDFEDYLELSRHNPSVLRIFKSGRVIESVSLAGLQSSDAGFRQCLAERQSDLTADAHDRQLKSLPKDPFGN